MSIARKFKTFLLLPFLVLNYPSGAQEPRRDYYFGDSEVELWKGLYFYSNTDIDVGESGGDGGLTLIRYDNVRGSDNLGPFVGHSEEIFIYRDRYREEGAGPGFYNYRYHVVRGNIVKTFEKYWNQASIYNSPGANITLTSSGIDGPFVFTDEGGTVANFPTVDTNCRNLYNAVTCTRVSSIIQPNGTLKIYGYDAPGGVKRLRLVTSNRGFGMGFEYHSNNRISKVCTLNIAVAHATISAPCPSGAPSVSYSYGQNPDNTKSLVVADPTGASTIFKYDLGSRLTAIRGPGSVVDDLTIAYQTPSGRVASQSFSSGTSLTYTYQQTEAELAEELPNEWTKVTDAAGKEVLHNFAYGIVPKPGSIVDEIGRTTQYRWSYGPYTQETLPTKIVTPEGNEVRITYDGRGNRTEVRRVAKGGSGLADIVSGATFPSTCVSRIYCNKPLTKTDSNGNTTTYIYDATHGGVLTETGPAVGGVSPQKRYEYAQRYAWVKNSAGTAYVQAPTPVWVMTRERYCRTTAPSGASCAGGAADEVVTDYDYGPDSGPNNLLVRGVAVTADGQTLRTCNGYDPQGRKISETKAAANLSVCP